MLTRKTVKAPAPAKQSPKMVGRITKVMKTKK